MRTLLENNQPITLTNKPSDGVYVFQYSQNEDDYTYTTLKNALRYHNNSSLLILCPHYKEAVYASQPKIRGELPDRIALKQGVDFSNQFTMVDAIDGAEYYKCAKKIDEYVFKCPQGRIKRVSRLCDILALLHLNKSVYSKWINSKANCLTHRKKEHAENSAKLVQLYEAFETDYSLQHLKAIFAFVYNLPGVKCYHRDFFNSIMRCLDIASNNGVSVYEAMKMYKARVRHQGRKIEGRCIGTTLLTKGLEFDTVIITNADKFEDKKNFYVAISRACKKLIFLTHSTTITFTR